MNKLLTIGIAVYNIKEEYLRSCLKSVTVNRSDNIEILLVDDCSETHCAEICRNAAADDSRIVYIRNELNTGISAVRNMIIARATGEWLMFVDGDDMLSPNFDETIEVLNDCGRDLIIFNNKTIFESELEIETECQNITAPLIDLKKDEIFDIAIAALVRRDVRKFRKEGFRLNPGSAIARAYKIEFLKNGKFCFDGSLKMAEDSLFSTAVLLGKPKAAICPAVMYYYRLNQYSVTHRYDEKSKTITDAYLKSLSEFVEEKLKNNREVADEFKRYRCVYAIIDNFELNIFHKDNPKNYHQRKMDFLNLLNSTPYHAAVESANPKTYSVHIVRLIIGLTKKRWFFMLNVCYKHNILFRLYGGTARRINDLKRRLKR